MTTFFLTGSYKRRKKKGEKEGGEVKEGLQNGQGKTTFPDGRKYVGEFKNGYWNGQGTETSPDGTKYVGELKDGTEHITTITGKKNTSW